MRALFVRCPDGHLFRNRSCPYDGWSHEQIATAEQLFADRPETTIQDLVDAGIARDLADRLVIIEAISIPTNLDGIQLKSSVTEGVVKVFG